MWSATVSPVPCFLGPDGTFLNESPEALAAGPVEIARAVTLVAHDRATGARISGIPTRTQCLRPGEQAQPPPTPPSPAQVWDAVPLPEPTINRSPVADGLVGLDTWLWADPVAPIDLDLTLGGYALNVTASPLMFHWDISDGAAYSSDRPGSEADPAATHVFQHGGEHTIAHRVIWSGSYTFSGYGISETADLGTVTRDVTDTMPVREIQAVIR